jgi:hypothetical protein
MCESAHLCLRRCHGVIREKGSYKTIEVASKWSRFGAFLRRARLTTVHMRIGFGPIGVPTEPGT